MNIYEVTIRFSRSISIRGQLLFSNKFWTRKIHVTDKYIKNSKYIVVCKYLTFRRRPCT